MTTKPYRSDLLTTEQLYNLDIACRPIRRAFGGTMTGCYLVGSAGFANVANEGRPARDVDVRLMLDDDQFAEACPTRERWELLCLAITAYLRDRTGLPIDFQVQQTSLANDRFGEQPRNPLGMGRTFAGGGDAAPDWERATIHQDASGSAPKVNGASGAQEAAQGHGGDARQQLDQNPVLLDRRMISEDLARDLGYEG